MRALVLSGGGLFGAWQAGAWSVLADHIAPDLIVGASVGSLNGYVIASGGTPEELASMWLEPAFARFADLPSNIRRMMARYTPRMPFAITATELPRMKPRIFRDSEITWQHLAASCALPLALPQVRIGTHWYSDGGLLGALPLWAAAELGAKHIIGLQALPQPPSWWLGQGSARFAHWRATILRFPPESTFARSAPAGVSARSATPSSGSAATSSAGSIRAPRTPCGAVTEKTFFF